MTISDIITFDLLSRYDGKIKNWIRALKATTTQDGLMSKEDKATLDGLVASGGEANVIEAVSVGGVAAPISGKTATINNVYTKGETDSAIAAALTSAVIYKGSVPTYADLPSSGMQNGWLYNVVATDMNYVWNSTSNDWDPQAPTVTVAAATNAQIDSLFT